MTVAPPSEIARQHAEKRLGALATPPGALGRLGEVGVVVDVDVPMRFGRLMTPARHVRSARVEEEGSEEQSTGHAAYLPAGRVRPRFSRSVVPAYSAG